MTKKPTISILMASYNHADFIGEAIKSIHQQDVDAWELLIADDASTDNTLEVLKAYSNDSRIKIFPFEINRQYHMRNFMAQKASGDFFAFLNSDDIFYPGKLSKQMQILEKNPSVAAVFTHVHCIDENSRRMEGHAIETILASENQTRHQWLRQFFLFGNRLCLSSAVIRRECFKKVGAFNPLLIQIGDLDLWIKVCLKNEVFVIPERLTARRILKRNLSSLTPETLSRFFLEAQQVYAHYFSPDAIEQAIEIFPELSTALPEDTPAWRYYLLCRIAAALPAKSTRFLGFTKLHELLENEEIKLYLQQNNPRLLKTFFFSEGTAGFQESGAEIEWVVFTSTPNSHQRLSAYWTAADGSSTICFSFPNPKVHTQLRLAFNGAGTTSGFGPFRLYNQQTGKLIFDSHTTVQPYQSCPQTYYDFPAIDFTALSSKWIDIEIDRTSIQNNTSAHKAKQNNTFAHKVKRKLIGLFGK